MGDHLGIIIMERESGCEILELFHPQKNINLISYIHRAYDTLFFILYWLHFSYFVPRKCFHRRCSHCESLSPNSWRNFRADVTVFTNLNMKGFPSQTTGPYHLSIICLTQVNRFQLHLLLYRHMIGHRMDSTAKGVYGAVMKC